MNQQTYIITREVFDLLEIKASDNSSIHCRKGSKMASVYLGVEGKTCIVIYTSRYRYNVTTLEANCRVINMERKLRFRVI